MQELHDIYDRYSRKTQDDRPLGAYAGLIALFNLELALFLVALKRSGRALPERIAPTDVLLFGVATQKISRLVTKDAVMSAVRAPFTQYEEPAGAGEINESPRGTGLRHAIGELLTCPFCFAQWVASMFAFGLVFAPRLTRLIAAMFAMVAVSDMLQD